MVKLYIIATPLGNLKDITYRAIEILGTVDIILCEDTRRTKKLLDHYAIKKKLLSYHQRSKLSKTDKIINYLEAGKDLALVTDAGTPGISDPGNELIKRVIAQVKEVTVVPIPGVSAITTLVSVAGINLSKFVFLGFPPNKKGRDKFFKKVLDSCFPVIYYESPYRLIKNLERLDKLKTGAVLKLIIGRELTKIHEEIRRGSPIEIIDYYRDNPDKLKGEFTVIVTKIKTEN